MGFNTNAFMLAGTAIAIFGVGLYIYDTRKEKIANYYTRPNNQYNKYSAQYDRDVSVYGGTKKHRKRGFQKKTKKNL